MLLPWNNWWGKNKVLAATRHKDQVKLKIEGVIRFREVRKDILIETVSRIKSEATRPAGRGAA